MLAEKNQPLQAVVELAIDEEALVDRLRADVLPAALGDSAATFVVASAAWATDAASASSARPRTPALPNLMPRK